MNRKNGGNECAPPQRAGHLQQYQKQQDDCDGLQDNICKVMATCVGAPQLAVQHMRQSCQRMPIAGMLAAERVNSAGNGQPISDERIRVNVGIIIVVDEVVADSLPENEPRYYNEKNADNCDAVALHFVLSFTEAAPSLRTPRRFAQPVTFSELVS